ncbi:signal transduction histidine kinase [Pelomonas saccharophila]|uniref:histidine kinase n=1 Tax=Roseateles saccharophilus TaxID=304 RepID=A0ABU1YRJ3_ROSSA|nr:ATP-binding protein [Roseateles saccharophilus]MDR7271472.1 signal transduction histidine kinase [Roseateles saccharophilus]
MIEPDDADSRSYSERVIVLAPTARDSEVTRRLLAEARIEGVACKGWRHADELMHEGAGALMVTDSAFVDPGFAVLLNVLERQPSWSNLPVLALCRHGMQAAGLREARLRNLTVLDRPTSTRVMISAVRTALRGRRWQYQIRDQIESLQRAERSLRQADQRKDEFLATLAHELRNPLAPIRTGLQLLGANPPQDSAHARSVTEMMNRQMNQLLRLIDDLLEVSRISTGKLILQREPLDMRRVVEVALESCQPLIERGGHHLSVSLPDEELCVDGDLTRLAQSLSNLLNNAAKYTPDGGSIWLTLSRAGGNAVLTVRDSGVGLPEGMTDRVFDMFAQVNRSLERAQGGLGIGLALVKSLVSLHGGRVSAASPGPGLGSTFTLELPLLAADSAPAPLPAAAEPEAARPARILVVDDNDDAAQSLAMLLSLSGHQVEVENSGQAALRKAASFLPQAVFCDVGMPGMGGHEFATLLRQDARFASTLLVALTGWGSEEDKKRSRAAGFDAHLTKPASVDAVTALLAQL